MSQKNPENRAQKDHKQELDEREDQELSVEELDAVAGGLPGQSAPARNGNGNGNG